MASLDANIEHGGVEDLPNGKVIGDRTRGERVLATPALKIGEYGRLNKRADEEGR